jgi:archaemetzincin
MGRIHLVPLPGSGESNLPRLGDLLGEIFHSEVSIAPRWREIDFAFDVGRGQYSSRAILAALLGGRFAGGGRVLGVTGLDLFVPVLTFVFGEAQLQGRAAVVSSCRLANEYYGLAPDLERLQERLEKEAVHELGHTYGLVHCPDSLCVMRSSTYVEELDLKDAGMCADCLGKLEVGRFEGPVLDSGRS